MRNLLATLILVLVFLILGSSSLLACHLGIWAGAWTVGHKENRVGVNSIPPRNILEISTEMTLDSSNNTTASSYVTTDSTIITTNCDFKSANIEKFFNDSYEQIAEESARGTGSIWRLWRRNGCSADQYGISSKLSTEIINTFSQKKIIIYLWNTSLICSILRVN